MIEFPKDFFWGAATSAYQVEGDNVNSDWWDWEKKAGLREVSGSACRHYELFQQDFDLARTLNHNAHRLSIEWSRVEPQEGVFSARELDHYRDVILSLKERGIEPVVTLHHFTNPLWFARSGGFRNKNAMVYFLRFVEKIVNLLANEVRFWVTINEPMVYVYHAYIIGAWPPQERSLFKAWQATGNLIAAHVQAYRLIKGIYRARGLPAPLVSIAQNVRAFLACNGSLKNRVALYLRDRYFNHYFLNKVCQRGALDFIGVNYYSRDLVDIKRWSLSSMLLDTCSEGHDAVKKNSLGWDIYPQGLYTMLLELKRYNLPLFILENGICTSEDDVRWQFIAAHLESVHLAISQGAKILGYLYWSLLDNFEWDKGFAPRFGLIEVDYGTYRRTVRESARKFSRVCETGRLE